MKCGEDLITEAGEQKVGIRQWGSLSLYPFNIFIDDITDERNKHAPTIGNMLIPGLLFADNLALGDFTIQGLKKGNGTVVAYCNKWNLIWNLQKSKIMVFQKNVAYGWWWWGSGECSLLLPLIGQGV